MSSSLSRWLRRVLNRGTGENLKVVRCEEIEGELREETLYVLGQGSESWFAVISCPCRCGGTLQVSLLPDAEPRWTLIEHDDGTVSLQPSLWRRDGCRSHFMVTRGRIEWCGATRRRRTSRKELSSRRRS